LKGDDRMIEKSLDELSDELREKLTEGSKTKLREHLIDINDTYIKIIMMIESDINSPLLWLRDIVNLLSLIIEKRIRDK